MTFGAVQRGGERNAFPRPVEGRRFSALVPVRVRTTGRIRIHGVAHAPLLMGPLLPSRRARSMAIPAGRVDVDRPLGTGRPRVVVLLRGRAPLLGQLVRLPVLREQPARQPQMEGLSGPLDQVGRLAADRGVLGVEDPLPVDLVVDRALVVSTLGEGCRTAVELAADLPEAVAQEAGRQMVAAGQMGTGDRSSPVVAAVEVALRRMTCWYNCCNK